VIFEKGAKNPDIATFFDGEALSKRIFWANTAKKIWLLWRIHGIMTANKVFDKHR